MEQIYSVLMNGGIGLASFLALILLGKYILEDMKESLDNNVKVLGDVTKTLELMNQNLSNLSERVYKLENKGDEWNVKEKRK